MHCGIAVLMIHILMDFGPPLEYLPSIINRITAVEQALLYGCNTETVVGLFDSSSITSFLVASNLYPYKTLAVVINSLCTLWS